MSENEALIKDARAWVRRLGGADIETKSEVMLWRIASALEAADAHCARVDAENDRIRADLPACDGNCHSEGEPVETCSRHGRTVAEVWEIVATVQAQRDAEIAARTVPNSAGRESLAALLGEMRMDGRSARAMADAAIEHLAEVAAP